MPGDQTNNDNEIKAEGVIREAIIKETLLRLAEIANPREPQRVSSRGIPPGGIRVR